MDRGMRRAARMLMPASPHTTPRSTDTRLADAARLCAVAVAADMIELVFVYLAAQCVAVDSEGFC